MQGLYFNGWRRSYPTITPLSILSTSHSSPMQLSKFWCHQINELGAMSSNSKLIADIEALLAAAKNSSIDGLDYGARMGMLAKVESIQYQLDDPVLAMYRHLSNVSSP